MPATLFETHRFRDIKHKLPADAWARWRNERHDGEFDAETVLYHQGDLALDTLELDDLPASDTVFLILVEGNLRVANHIYNEETDGAPGLIVLGDLQARNAVVGGQEIYVTGNLVIEELFWGDYNHGTLKVAGNADIALLVDTEGYHVEIAGKQRFRRHLSTLDAATDPGSNDGLAEPLALFPADCVIDADSEYPILYRSRMLERLRASQPVIHADLLQARQLPAPAIPPLCPDRTLSVDNLERLTQPHLLLQPANASQTPRLEFWRGDLFCRAAAGEEEDGSVFRSVYFQNATHAAQLRFNQVRIPGGLLRRSTQQWLPALRWREMSGEQTDWHDCDVLPTQCTAMFDQGWNALLDGVATHVHARALIAPERLSALLALPLAAPYDDFYDDDRNGLWLGNVYCAFRQEGVIRKGHPQPALLRVACNRTDDGNERYDFSLRRHLDGSASVHIEYCPQEGKDWIDVSYTAPQHLPQALRMFEAAWNALQRSNGDLLEGTPPNQDDAFALKHWRAAGYLT